MKQKLIVPVLAALLAAGAAAAVVAQTPSAPLNAAPPNAKGQTPAFEGQTRAPLDAKGVNYDATVWAKGLDHPWGLVFLPDGRGLVTERPGRIRYINTDGSLSDPLTGVPAVVTTPPGQAGMFDIELDPAFARNKRIYVAYMEQKGANATLAVMRAELNGNALANQKVIFEATPDVPASNNMGGRMVFDRTGALIISVGDRFSSPGARTGGHSQNYDNNQSQLLNSDLGKFVRIDTDGNPAKGNPFLGRADARNEIYVYGSRSQESVAVNPSTGVVWEVENGPMGGDEINILQPGKNYGWPVIGYGEDYTRVPVADNSTQKAGMEQPIYYWDPVVAPSGMLFYTGNKFPAWKGSLFVGGLGSQSLVRLTLKGDKVVGEERLLPEKGIKQRIRDVRQGPDGLIYVLTDNTAGVIYRLSPAK